MRPNPPSIAGWETLEWLGAGGMGEVWKARRADGALAAIKVIRESGKLPAADAASLFRRESLACLHADHPNLVRALDAGTTADGRAFLAMEFIDGRTLEAVIRDEGALPEERVVAIGASLARALDHVHRMGLVHHDVKPANVIVADGGAVKLLDLGLVAESAVGDSGRTMGTRGYVAPENVFDRSAGPASDLFSLGATLLAAATGRPLGPGRSPAGTAPPKTVDGRSLSPGFRQVVERLLRADPAARYRTAAELSLDLDAVAAGERPLGAILGSAGSRTARRLPRIAAGAAVVAAAALAAAWAVADRGPGAAPAATGAHPLEPAPARHEADAKVEAARVYVETLKDDFARGRELIAAADSPALDATDRSVLDRLRAECDRRFSAAAQQEFDARRARQSAAEEAGDVPETKRIAAEWPESLRGSPLAEELSRSAAGAADRRRARNEGLAAEAARAAAEARTAADDRRAALSSLIERLDAALAAPSFDDDAHDRLAQARTQLGDALRTSMEAGACAAAAAKWKTALVSHAATPGDETMRALLAAGADPAMATATRDSAAIVADAWRRAQRRLADRTASLAGKDWCGPLGGRLVCGRMEKRPSPAELFSSPLWSAAGGRARAVTAAADGAAEAAAWLFANGLWEDAEAAAGPQGLVSAWLGEMKTAPRDGRGAWPPGFDAELALRDVDAPARSPSGRDAVAAAWAAAVGSRERSGARPRTNPAKESGGDAFLRGDFAAADAALGDAAVADPADAEVAVLRARLYLVAGRPFATSPALIASFSEARRAWDLAPKLPAGAGLTAETGIALLECCGEDQARRLRPVVAAACEAADAIGRADAKMLLFAGEFRLAAGRVPEAAAMLARAAEQAPGEARAWLALARAERAAARTDRARAALRRARDLLGGKLPDAAAELARELGI